MKVWQTLAAAVLVAGSSLAVFAADYKVDPVHSSAVFRIKHLNTAYFYGRITGPEGSVVYDASKPEATTFDVTMKVDNIDTGNGQRDNHLKSPSFFDSKEYPTLTFKSTSVKKADGNNLEVTGDLTIHGVKKSVTVKVEHTGAGKGMKGQAIVGFEAVFDIKRSDFGIKEMPDALGDDVRLMVSLEAGQ